jgi:hypothetical protein
MIPQSQASPNILSTSEASPLTTAYQHYPWHETVLANFCNRQIMNESKKAAKFFAAFLDIDY